MGLSSSRVHFIAIGGSAMHNLAIALHHKGYDVTGSDDEIFEPSRTQLNALNLLPDQLGWHPRTIPRTSKRCPWACTPASTTRS